MMEKQDVIINEDMADAIIILQNPTETETKAKTEEPLPCRSESNFEAPAEISAESLENIKYINEGTFEIHYVDDEPQSLQSVEYEEDGCYNAEEEYSEAEPLEIENNKESSSNIVETANEKSKTTSSAALCVTEEYLRGLSVVQQNIIKMEMEISRQNQAAEEQWVPKREILKEDFLYVPIRGGRWIKSNENKKSPKQGGFFSKLFKCLNPF